MGRTAGGVGFRLVREAAAAREGSAAERIGGLELHDVGRVAGVGLGPSVALEHVAFRELHAGGHEMVVHGDLGLDVRLGDRFDPDVRQRLGVAGHVADHETVHLLVQRLGEGDAVVDLQHVALLALEGGAQPLALGDRGEVGAPVEGGDGAVHALDEAHHRRLAGVEVDVRDVGVAVHEANPGAAPVLQHLGHLVPGVGAGRASVPICTRRVQPR